MAVKQLTPAQEDRARALHQEAISNTCCAGETELEGDLPTDGYAFAEHLKPKQPGTSARCLTEIGRQVVAEMNRLGIIIGIFRPYHAAA